MLSGGLTIVAQAAERSSEATQDRIRLLEQRLQILQTQFEQTVREQQQKIQELEQELARLRGETSQQGAAAGQNPPETFFESPVHSRQTSWNPTQSLPWRLGQGGTYVDVGLVGTFAAGGSTARDIEGSLQLGGHDPNQRGFTVQGVEWNLIGAVDPYFLGSANLLYALDAEGESEFELEEAWLQTTQLPAGWQIRAGQIYAPFGRFNGRHLHQWGFVDAPLVVARLLGPDGLRNPGVQAAWLMPTAFYSELFLSLLNSGGHGAAPFRGADSDHHKEDGHPLPLGFRPAENDRGVSALTDFLWAARYAVSVDLTEEQTLLMGVSAAVGPNSSGMTGSTQTKVFGADLYWKWRSPRAHAGFPFVSLQIEALLRKYDLGAYDWTEAAGAGTPYLADGLSGAPAVLHAETVTDYGVYTELLYGFRRGWIAGFRCDFVAGSKGDYERALWIFEGTPLSRDSARSRRWRLSPNLTWYPSEYSRLRLQYNYDQRQGMGTDHSLWLQWELSLGAHAAHQF